MIIYQYSFLWLCLIPDVSEQKGEWLLLYFRNNLYFSRIQEWKGRERMCAYLDMRVHRHVDWWLFQKSVDLSGIKHEKKIP